MKTNAIICELSDSELDDLLYDYAVTDHGHCSVRSFCNDHSLWSKSIGFALSLYGDNFNPKRSGKTTTMKTEKTKAISWAYPTSSNATKFGFSKSGCWVVSHIAPQSRGYAQKCLKAFAEYEEALAFAEGLPEEYDRHSAGAPKYNH